MEFEMATVPLPRSVLAVALATAMLGSRVAVGLLPRAPDGVQDGGTQR